MRDSKIEYRLTYGALEGDVTQAHIHLGNRVGQRRHQRVPVQRRPGDRAGGHAGMPGGTLGHRQRVTIEPADVIGPGGPGHRARPSTNELLRAIRAGVTYANVHSSKYPGGEIRAQLERDHYADGVTTSTPGRG